jgi:hypothetical protein
LLLALDDSINPKTGRKVFACQDTFDHAAKTNQSQFPWAQTIVTVGLLKITHGRWSCLPLAFDFYMRLKTLRSRCIRVRGQALVFRTKFAQAVQLIERLAGVFVAVPILVVTDSWFGNRGLLTPLRAALGPRVQLLTRLRVNTVLHDRPGLATGRSGRPRKYGPRLGNAAHLAETLRAQARAYTLPLYGRVREVMAVERQVMLKTLRCQVRVVWVFRNTQWVALVTTDLTLTVEQMIEYYGARWKIEIYQSWCLHKMTIRGWRRCRRPRRAPAVPSGGGRRDWPADAPTQWRRPIPAIGADRRARPGGPAADLCATN